MKKKVIEFIKNQWQKILLFFAAILFIVIGLCSKNCKGGPVLKAYESGVTSLTENVQYQIFSFDSLSFHYTGVYTTALIPQDFYYTFPLSNIVYDYNYDISKYTTELKGYTYIDNSRYSLGQIFVYNSEPVSTRFDCSFVLNRINQVELYATSWYIPSNILDYYNEDKTLVVELDGLHASITSLNCNISYKFRSAETINYETIEETFELIPESNYTSIDLLGGQDLSNFVYDKGCYIYDYRLSFSFTASLWSTDIIISQPGLIELPTTIILPEFQETCPVCPDYTNIGNFLIDSIGSFMDFEIFPGFSISGLLASIMAIGLFILFLKVFAGG